MFIKIKHKIKSIIFNQIKPIPLNTKCYLNKLIKLKSIAQTDKLRVSLKLRSSKLLNSIQIEKEFWAVNSDFKI